jgi:DNA-binding response OmpR family regulator
VNMDLRAARLPPLVLILTDRPVLAEVVQLALRHGHLRARVALNVTEAEQAIAAARPHVAIIDQDVGDGEILDQLGYTSAGANGGADRVPVLALTRRGDLKTKLAAFEQGVDDILTVPFSPEELVARVLAIMRRIYRDAVPFSAALQFGELEIDILHRSVRVGGHELPLTSLEQSLLYLMAANAGRLLTRDEILDYLWGTDYIAESNIVDRHVHNLRAKLRDDWHRPRYIATVPGKGYRFLPVTTD